MDNNKSPRTDYSGKTKLKDWWKIVKENFERIFSYADEVREYAEENWNAASSQINTAQTAIDEHKKDFGNTHGVTADQIPTVFGGNINDELYELKSKKASLDSDNTFAGENSFTGLVNVPGTLVASGSTSISGGVEIQTDNVMLSQSGDLAIKGDLFVKDVDILYELGQRASQGDIQDGLANKASLSQINTFTEENIYKSILRSEGVFEGSLDTYVTGIDGTHYNVPDELAKIDGKADVLISTTEKSKATKLTDTKNIPLLDYKIYGSSDGVGVLDEATGEYVFPVKVYGKNLAKLKKGADVYNPGHTMNADGSITVYEGEGEYSAPSNIYITGLTYYATSDSEKLTASCKGATSQVYFQIGQKRGTEATKYINVNSASKVTITDVKAGDRFTFVIQVKTNAVVPETITLYPQLELGNIATEYESFVEPVTVNIPLPAPMAEGDYVDYANKKIVAQGNEHTNVELPEIITNYPSTTIMCDGEMQITYKVDEVKAYTNMKSELDTLKQAVISLGGTL